MKVQTKDDRVSFVDICAGIGGFRLGLEPLGFKCVQSIEINKDCVDTYNANFNDCIIPSNLFDYSPCDINDHDILCSGFPCQPFSIAGKRLGLKDERGILIEKIIEIAIVKQPKILFLAL